MANYNSDYPRAADQTCIPRSATSSSEALRYVAGLSPRCPETSQRVYCLRACPKVLALRACGRLSEIWHHHAHAPDRRRAPVSLDSALTTDDELDAALALAGLVDLPLERRYCFQTTYLNERYEDYRTLDAGQRLIWVLRNHYSVV